MSLIPEKIVVNGKQELVYRIDGHPITDLVIFDYTLTRTDRHRLELIATGELKSRNITSVKLKGSSQVFEVEGLFLKILQSRLQDLGTWGNEHFQYLFRSEAEYRAKRETGGGTGGNRPDSATDALLASKVDKVFGKGLSARDFTAAYEEKLENLIGSQFRGVFASVAQLAGIPTPIAGDYADVDSVDGFVRCAYNATTNAWVVPVAEAEFDPAVLETKVDKVVGKGLSTEDFTTAEKAKLASLEGSHFRGLFATYAELSTIVDPVAGDYADVDGGVGETVDRHIWDVTDGDWYVVQGESTEMTGAQIKENYEAQPDTNAFTDDEKAKLATVASDLENLDITLVSKVDKEDGKGLSEANFTDDEKAKLTGIEVGATKNRSDSENADKEHTHTWDQVTGLDTALESKVDKEVGKGLSEANFTQAEKTKLASLESSKFVGLFMSESALPSTGSEGDYANVDGGVGGDVYRVIWDSTNSKWVAMQGSATEPTEAQLKQLYESNPDTNAFTDDEKAKLTGIAAAATKNRADSENADKVHTHTIEQVDGLRDAIANIPSVSKTSAYTVTAANKGASIDTTANVTIPASVFAVGDVIVVTNTSASDSSITPASGVTFRLAGSDKTGVRTLAGYGVATLRMASSNVWFASGAGLS